MSKVCPRCEGSQIDPEKMGGLDVACRQCEGRGTVPGRPEDWPPIGAKIRSTIKLEILEVVDEDLGPDWLPCRAAGGEIVRIPPEHVGPGKSYEVVEEVAAP